MFAVVGLPLSEAIHEFLAMRQFNALSLVERNIAPQSAIEAIIYTYQKAAVQRGAKGRVAFGGSRLDVGLEYQRKRQAADESCVGIVCDASWLRT